jgi:hypothetical protein
MVRNQIGMHNRSEIVAVQRSSFGPTHSSNSNSNCVCMCVSICIVHVARIIPASKPAHNFFVKAIFICY